MLIAEPTAESPTEGVLYLAKVAAGDPLAEIHRRQDRIAAAYPDTYFDLETWQRLDARAQRICAAGGW